MLAKVNSLNFLQNDDYQALIVSIKQQILRAQNIAVKKVNIELITLYYEIGKQITIKQQETNWGDDLIGQIEKDIKKIFPNISGFSRRNINYMRSLYKFVLDNQKMQQRVAQIPWGHLRFIFDK